MKISSTASKTEKGSHCEEDDLDVTFVTDTKDTRNISTSSKTSDNVKKKKKHNSSGTLSDRHVQSPKTQNTTSQLTEESESLLKMKKQGLKKSNGINNEHMDYIHIQSQSLLMGVNMSDSLLTDDSESFDSDKRKKRKVKYKENNGLVKKKRKDTIEFLTQDVFKQPSSEEVFMSTPFSSPKIVNKKGNGEHLKQEDMDDYMSNFLNGTKEKTMLVNGKKKAEFVLKKRKLKLTKTNGLINNSFIDSDVSLIETSGYSRLHSSVNLSDLDDSSLNLNGSELILPNEAHKKKKHFNPKQTGSGGYNMANDEKSRLEKENGNNQNSDNGDVENMIAKKKSKKKINSSFKKSCLDKVERDIKENGSKNGHQEPSSELESNNNLSPKLNASRKNKTKKSKENSNPSANVPKEEGHARGYIRESHKLGLYSPSQSFGMDSSSSRTHILNKIQNLSHNTTNRSHNGNDDSKESENETSSDEGVNEEDKLPLRTLLTGKCFDVDFKVPELHRIVNRASKPTPQQRALIKARDIKVKYGKFTEVDDKQIKENWKHFIEANGLDDEPNRFFCLDKQYISGFSKKNFLYHLARDMPTRTPYAVFKRFKLIMAQTKKGRFTTEEDDYILETMKEDKGRRNYISKIAKHLQRDPAAIEKRIKKIQNAHTRKIKWKGKNAAAFIKYLLKITKVPKGDIEELKNRHVTSQEWGKLSKKLDNVPTRILVRTWQEKLHPALFIPTDSLDLREVKLKLIKMLNENNETDWRRVNWSDYASHFEGLTYLRIYSLMKQVVKVYVPPSQQNDLKKCLKVLVSVPEDRMRKQIINKIKYKKGEVIELIPNKQNDN